MKSLILIAILIALTATQTTVTPKSQACECSNLLNLADCLALSGCTWTGNSTNTTASTGKSFFLIFKELVLTQQQRLQLYHHFVGLLLIQRPVQEHLAVHFSTAVVKYLPDAQLMSKQQTQPVKQ